MKFNLDSLDLDAAKAFVWLHKKPIIFLAVVGLVIAGSVFE